MLDISPDAYHSASGEKGRVGTSVGRSRGGRTSKIHCPVDGHGRPIMFALKVEQYIGNISMTLALLNSDLENRGARI